MSVADLNVFVTGFLQLVLIAQNIEIHDIIEIHFDNFDYILV